MFLHKKIPHARSTLAPLTQYILQYKFFECIIIFFLFAYIEIIIIIILRQNFHGMKKIFQIQKKTFQSQQRKQHNTILRMQAPNYGIIETFKILITQCPISPIVINISYCENTFLCKYFHPLIPLCSSSSQTFANTSSSVYIFERFCCKNTFFFLMTESSGFHTKHVLDEKKS